MDLYGPRMQTSFETLLPGSRLVQVVRELGYEVPTPIQTRAIPSLLAGRDVAGQSKTGSGKTAAFGLPILEKIELERRELQALVLCPTRELAGQVVRELRKLGSAHSGLRVLELIGGKSARTQRESLNHGAHIAVGTPGRLLDHMRSGALDSRTIRSVVVDEADRMLDMGFEEEVEGILKCMPAERQTALFSATFPDAIEVLMQRYLRDAEHVLIEGQAAGASSDSCVPDGEDAPQIRQLHLSAKPDEKLAALAWLLNEFPHESALIFCNFKATAAELVSQLSRAGASVARLDGDLDQFQRTEVMARFRNQSVRLLVATDVAGRGLDVEGLDLVVNFELPQKPDIYVHRVGRTGRAGRAGLAISLSRGQSDKRVAEAEAETGAALETLEWSRARQGRGGVSNLNREPLMATIKIMGGRSDKLRPGDILGALTGKVGGLNGSEVGKIEVHDRFTYVAVALREAERAAQRLDKGQIKKKRYRATCL